METTKGREDFKNEKAFIRYCKRVAAFLYKLLYGKDIDDG